MFEIRADNHQWILTHVTWITGKNGEKKQKRKETYHPNLDQVSRHILKTMGAECKDINELRDLFNTKAEELGKVILMKSPVNKTKIRRVL